jgi:hypothetical protein
MIMTDNALLRNSASRTVEVEDNDPDIQNSNEFITADTDFNNIALTELEGANNPDEQAQKANHVDNAGVDWCVNVLVRAVE